MARIFGVTAAFKAGLHKANEEVSQQVAYYYIQTSALSHLHICFIKSMYYKSF